MLTGRARLVPRPCSSSPLLHLRALRPLQGHYKATHPPSFPYHHYYILTFLPVVLCFPLPRTPGCTCGRCGAPSLVAFSGKRQFLELLNVGRSARDRIKTVEVGAGKPHEWGGGDPARVYIVIAADHVAPCGDSAFNCRNAFLDEPLCVLVTRRRAVRPVPQIGPQRLLPAGWPFPAGRTEVWVCSSTSGAAAMTTEQREGPYQQLAERLRGIQWPRAVELACGGQGGAGS